VAIALAVLLVSVGVAVLAGGGDPDSDSSGPALPAPPRAGKQVAYEEIGAKLSRPPGWGVSRSDRALVFRSRDRTTVLSVSSPPGDASGAGQLLRSALREIRRSYTDVTARPGDGRRVAGLPTSGVVVSARNARGVQVRILVAAVQGRDRAWLVQVFAVADGSAARLVEAQVALGTLTLES
jgi:hypothetical protein